MTTKKSKLERRLIVKVDDIDLNELYVRRIPEGKKRPTNCQMTVRDFIELLASYDQNGIVHYDGGYDGCYPTLHITTTRQETDEEYAERLAILKELEIRKTERVREQRKLRTSEEIETLKKLAKKYNIEITKDLP